MPTYDYRCDACEHQFELYQSITAEPEKKCPECGKKKLRRLIGPGAAIMFKGSGFYCTDYRSASYQKGASAEKSSTSSANGSGETGAKSAEGKSGGSTSSDKPAKKEKPAAKSK